MTAERPTDEALLPCPFCGQEARYYGAAVRCTNFRCNASLNPNWTTKLVRSAGASADDRVRIAKAETARRWNNRTIAHDDMRTIAGQGRLGERGREEIEQHSND